MALEQLETRAVLSAAFDVVGITSLRNDPMFSQIDGQGPDGRKIGVAILDTGVFGNHPDLRSNFVAYYDAVTRSSDTTNPAGSRDPEGHGTHVSGTAVSSNPAYGVATRAGLIGVRVLATEEERLPAHDTVAEGLRWVAQVHQQYNIRVVNMSLGSLNFNASAIPQGGAAIASAIRVLERLGITVVTAAGNSWAQYQQEGSAFPGNVSTVSVVNTWATTFTAASPQDALIKRQGGGGRNDTYLAVELSAVPDQLAATSQRSGGLSSQIAAPGTNITSTSHKGGTASETGTSMASPLVAGVVALMQDAAQTFGGRWLTPTEVHSILRSSADTIVDTPTNGNGRFPRSAVADRILSWGEVSSLAETGKSFPRVNAHRAVQAVRTLLGGGSAPVTGQDLNGTMATAVTVPDLDGTRVFQARGSIGRDGNTSVGSNDVDLVKIQLTSPGSVSIRVDADPNGRSFDPYLRLFNASGQQIAAVNNTNGNYPVLQSVPLQPGIYYAGISSFNNSTYGVVSATGRSGGGSEGEYLFTVTLENPDPNGVIQGAAPANEWQALAGGVSGYFWSYGQIGSDPAPVDGNPRVPIGMGDVDMFEVVAPDTGWLMIAVHAARGLHLTNTNPFDAYLRVHTQNGSLLDWADNSFNITDPSVRVFVTRGQRLFVGVSAAFNTSYSATEPYGRPTLGGTGTYEIIHWFDTNDANGSAWAAVTTANLQGTPISGQIGADSGLLVGEDGTKDVDFFSYAVQQSGMLDVTVAGQSGFVPAATLWKWDPVQKNVVRMAERVGGNVNHRIAAQAGEIFYVSVTGFGNVGYQWFATASGSGGATGSYTITGSVQSASAVWQMQDDTFQSASLGVLGVDNVRFGELGADDTLYRGTTDVDLYRFQPQSSGRMAFAASGDGPFGASPVLRLFDASGSELAFSASSAEGLKGSSLEFDVVGGQTYYVGVSGWADSANLRGYQPQGTLSTVSGSAGDYIVSATRVLTFTPGGVTIGTVEFGAIPAGYALRIGGSNGQVIPVTYQGVNASASFPGSGWQGLGGRQAGAGYQFLWRNASSGQFAAWTLDASGAYVGGSLLSAAQIRFIEIEVNKDIDGNGSVAAFTPSGVTIGTVEFGAVSGAYALRVGGSNGPVIPVTYQGVITSAAFPGGGWQGLGGRQDGGGYQFLWRNASSGQFAGWNLDASGAFVGGSVLSAAQIRGIEIEVNKDIDGDGAIGVVFTSSGMTIGTVEFGTVAGEYWLRVGGSSGQVIPVTYRGVGTSAAFPGSGWQGLGGRQAGAGYQFLWRNASLGLFAGWSLDASGAYVGGSVLSAAQVRDIETELGRDIDGDGSIGVEFTPSGVTIGTVEFGTIAGEYWLRDGSLFGQMIPVTYGGKNASASNPGGGWRAVGARTADGGGYELLWVNRANARPGAVYGTFGSWALASTGALSAARSVSLSEILALEGMTQIDIDGNGLVGASTNVKLGAMGDSLIDEHFDQGIGYSRNWYEIMVDAGRINGGQLGSAQPGGDWGDDRGTGFEFNVALAGATTSTLVDRGQHTRLAQLALAKGISHAVLIVGANDFFPAPPGSGSAYEAIYNGLASPQMINAFVTEAIADWRTAVTALKTAGVKVVGSTIPDYGIAPYTRERYPDAAKRERVTSVIRQINATVLRTAASNLGVPLVDIFTLTRDIWGPNGSERQTFNLGGVALQLAGRAPNSADTPAAFADDGIHPMNTIGGVFANLVMDAMNTHYGTSFQLFPEWEILGRAGMILAGGYDGTTLETALGKPLSSYVLAPIRTG